MILIGSHALKFHIPEFSRRIKDCDLMASYDEFIKFIDNKEIIFQDIKEKKAAVQLSNKNIYEIEFIWSDSTAASFEELVLEDKETSCVHSSELGTLIVPSLNALYVLKLSHRYLKDSPHFLKNMSDIILMRNHGAKIPEQYRAWLKLREKETYDYSHPSLMRSKTNFFDPKELTYTYDHDTIHQAMAHLDAPAYTFFQKDGAEVLCDRNKFDALEEIKKLYSVAEESYVLALERSQIPFPGSKTPRQSFLKALEKVCTSIASGWWREYAYDHYFDVLEIYDDTYVDRFWKAVDEGVVKKLEDGVHV